MNFSENLNLLINVCKITNSFLSKNSGIDPSLISRYKNGERVPHKGSDEINKLSLAFIKLPKIKIEKLYYYFKINDIEELRIQIYDFLNDSELRVTKKTKNKEKIVLTRFAEKLNSIMNILGISNIELANYLKIDASLISRYRKNLRVIYSNNKYIDKIGFYLFQESLHSNKLYDIYNLMNQKKFYSKDKMQEYIISWLKTNDKLNEDMAIENFLIQLSNYEHDSVKNNYNNEIIQKFRNRKIYIGIEGLKSAYINFFEQILKYEKKVVMHIYTNQKIDWIYNDSEFKIAWYQCIKKLIDNGNKIILYRDIDYSVEKMINSLVDFLPLYYSGQIEYRYITKTQRQKFLVNFLIVPNVGYLYSSGVVDAEKYIEHLISFDKEKTNNYWIQFKNIINFSYPLLVIKDTSKQTKYLDLYRNYNSKTSDAIGLISSPFLGSMNSSLLYQILNRNNLDEKDKNKIIEFYNIRKKTFEKMIKTTKTIDYILIKNPKANLDLSSVYNYKTLYYTEEEYLNHLRYLKFLSKKYPNYNVKFISNVPFNNLKILIKKDYGVIISKETKNNKVSFILYHNIFIESFKEYALILENN